MVQESIINYVLLMSLLMCLTLLPIVKCQLILLSFDLSCDNNTSYTHILQSNLKSNSNNHVAFAQQQKLVHFDYVRTCFISFCKNKVNFRSIKGVIFHGCVSADTSEY